MFTFLNQIMGYGNQTQLIESDGSFEQTKPMFKMNEREHVNNYTLTVKPV